MIKYLVKKGYVDFNKIILENYSKFNVTEQEVFVLITLVELYKLNKNTFSTSSIAKRTNLSNDICSTCLNSILNKGLISIKIEYSNNKAKEVFSLDELFNVISKTFNDEIKLEKIQQSEGSIEEIITLVENTLNKSLSPYELEIILEWSNSNIPLNIITKAIDIALSKNISNIRYIDKIILSSNNNEIVNEDESKVLDDIFRNLK